jgi:hypothetical protein
MMKSVRALVVGTVAVIGGVSLAACGSPSAKPHVPGGNNAPVATHPTSTSTTTAPPGGAQQTGNLLTVPGTPENIAYKFVFYSNEVNYADLFAPNGFAQWAVNIKPYCTPAYYATVAAAQRAAIAAGNTGPNSSYAKHLIAEQETLGANVLDDARIDEAGYTSTQEWIQVTYTITTARGYGPQDVSPPQVEQLLMEKVSGAWFVAKVAATPVG